MKTLPLALATLLLCAAAQAATSTFDHSLEGWTAVGDSEGPLRWSATGGRPSGHVLIDDQTLGGITYFVAPKAFLGDQSAAFGSLLGFDLMQVYGGRPNQVNHPDVMLQGAGLSLVYDTAVNPANGSWSSYAVPLKAGGWRLDSLTGALASDAQLRAVLSQLTALKIRAEFQSGSDIGHLDNVSMVPEPASTALFVAGLLAMMGWLQRRRGGGAADAAA
jgi:hypothetical protein